MKKIRYYLQQFDGIWSVPLGFFAFFLVGNLLSYLGMAVGQYDMAFIQPLFLAGTIVVGATNIAVAGLYFTFRAVYKYLYGSIHNGELINISKEDFFELQPIQRICVSLFLFCYFAAFTVIVYLRLV